MSDRKLILFDWDGTLSDIPKVLTLALPEFSKLMNLPYDIQKFSIGYFDPKTEDMGWGLSFEEQVIMREKWNAFLLEKTLNDNLYIAPLYVDALQVFQDLQKEYDLGIVTARDRMSLLHMIKHHEIDKDIIAYRSSSCAMENGYEIKPSPDAIISFIKETGHAIDRTVMIGDAPADIEMAKAAGVKSIAALWGIYPEKILEAAAPTILLKDIKDLPQVLEGIFENV